MTRYIAVKKDRFMGSGTPEDAYRAFVRHFNHDPEFIFTQKELKKAEKRRYDAITTIRRGFTKR